MVGQIKNGLSCEVGGYRGLRTFVDKAPWNFKYINPTGDPRFVLAERDSGAFDGRVFFERG
jgi:hypothetical protein